MIVRAIAAFVVAVTMIPSAVYAKPFGGQITIYLPCFNLAVFSLLSGPRGGAYIWSPATRTYRFGAPRNSGQWLLGLASAPYYCVWSISPVLVAPGLHIDMMGSSQPGRSSTGVGPESAGQWRWPQFTSGEQYDAEIDRLRSQAVQCSNNVTSECQNLTATADLMATERNARFGSRVIECNEGVNCVIN